MAKMGALAIGAAGIGGIALVLKQGIAEFSEASKVSAQTGAVLKSTGGAANVTAKQVSALSAALMQKSGVDDEAIQSGENMLLTFTRIRNETGKGNDIFNQATKATLNLSVAMGKDMSSSAILVGKALNDPVKGMTALTRAGIQFTEGQKKTIAAMVESGNVMGAQKIILGELTTQFGGSAEALGKTLPGQINILKESFNNMAGTMVGALVPAFTTVMSGASDFIQRLGEADGASAKFGVAMDTIKTIAGKVWEGLKSAFNAINWPAVGQTLSDGLRRALTFLGSLDYAGALRTVGTKVLDTLKSTFNAINWGDLGSRVGKLLVAALDKLSSFMGSVNWNAVGQAMVAGMGKAIGAFASFLAGVNWPSVLKAVGSGIIAVLKGLAGLLVGIATALGKAIITGIGTGLANLASFVKAKMQALPGALRDVAAQMPALAFSIGTAIVQGIINGLQSMAGAVASKARDIAGSAISAAKDALKVWSPSRVFFEIGENTIRGFILGITAQQPALEGKMAEATQKALDKAKATVEGFQTSFGEAFGKLGDYAKRAFDAKTQNILDNVAKKFDAQIAKWQGFAQALTPAEQALADMDKAEAKSALATNLRLAEEAQAKANSMADGAEKDAAQVAAEAMKQAALTAMTRAGLVEQAAVERAAQEAQAATQIAALEATKARQLQNLEEQRRQLGEGLASQLATLQERLSKHPEEYDKIQKKINALLASYGVPMQKAGENLGKAFARGIRNSIDDAVAAAKALAKAVAQYLPHSPAEKGALSKPINWAGYITAGLPETASALSAATARLAGAAVMPKLGGGGYTAGPAMAGAAAMGGVRAGGGNTYNIYASTTYGDERSVNELVRKIRTDLLRTAARN